MNYKEKYLKYKKKYLEQKNKIGLIGKLLTLYPSCKFDNNIVDNYTDHTITYGEMDYDGLDSLVNFLDTEFTSFIDIGSGRGKLCIYMLKYPSIIKSLGVEVVKERHDDAIELKNKLNEFSGVNSVEFINDDFMTVNLSSFNNTTPLIWLSNLCFTDDITNNIYNKVINEMPSGTIICSSKNPTISSDKLNELGKTEINMSWNKNSIVHCYEINK